MYRYKQTCLHTLQGARITCACIYMHTHASIYLNIRIHITILVDANKFCAMLFGLVTSNHADHTQGFATKDAP